MTATTCVTVSAECSMVTLLLTSALLLMVFLSYCNFSWMAIFLNISSLSLSVVESVLKGLRSVGVRWRFFRLTLITAFLKWHVRQRLSESLSYIGAPQRVSLPLQHPHGTGQASQIYLRTETTSQIAQVVWTGFRSFSVSRCFAQVALLGSIHCWMEK